MNAADGIRALQFWDRVRAWLTKGNLIVAGVLIVGGFAYCAGVSHGTATARSSMADSVRHVLADSSAAIEQRLAARQPLIQQTAVHVDTVRLAYHDDRAHVAIVSDTVLRVDSVLVSVPMPVVRVIERADSLSVADSIAYHAVAAQLDDMTNDRNTWRTRAQLDEAQKPSRFGFRSGLALGAGIVGAIVWLVK